MAKELQLTKGFSAIVDDADYLVLSKWKWCALVVKSKNSTRVYACRAETKGGKYRMIMMHRQILGGTSKDIDHIDMNTLNNQMGNLRSATRSQNNANRRKQPGGNFSSRHKGVHFHRSTRKWAAQIRKKHIGMFKEECDAATAYNFAALEAYGEFARYNIP